MRIRDRAISDLKSYQKLFFGNPGTDTPNTKKFLNDTLHCKRSCNEIKNPAEMLIPPKMSENSNFSERYKIQQNLHATDHMDLYYTYLVQYILHFHENRERDYLEHIHDLENKLSRGKLKSRE